MIFSLEALQAEQGDCFLIHFGDTGAAQVMLVDGGPGRDVYDARLKARLNALRSHFGAFELCLVVCSHIDDDHIGGVLALVQDVELGALDIKINCLWHNRPLDLVGEADEQRLAAMSDTNESQTSSSRTSVTPPTANATPRSTSTSTLPAQPVHHTGLTAIAPGALDASSCLA